MRQLCGENLDSRYVLISERGGPATGMMPRLLQHYMGHKTSCARFDTPNWRLIGSGISGRTPNCSKTKPDLRVLRPGRDA